MLGARWRENLRLPDGDIGGDRSHLGAIVELIRRARPRTIAVPYGRDRHPDHVAASRLLTRAAFLSGLTRYAAAGEKWRADWLLYYFINDSRRPSFVVDVSAQYKTKRAALACHRSQFAPPSASAAATRLNTPRFQQLIESRDAQFGADRRRICRGWWCANCWCADPAEMNIGIVCYASVGGSGVVASELARCLAEAGIART